MGLATFDPDQAARELLSLARGQWANGMVPHIIFGPAEDHWEGPDFWRSREVEGAPAAVDTSAVTQPPVVTIAAEVVGSRLAPAERERFLRAIHPMLVRHHTWMYGERVRESGLVVVVHPWETGLDTSPPWMELFARRRRPLDKAVHRGDTLVVPLEERPTDVEAAETAALAETYRGWGYDSQTILDRSPIVVESLDFNAILVQANESLRRIAGEVGEPIQADLLAAMGRTAAALETLWDDARQEYFSRDHRRGELVAESSVAAFMPLFAGTATPSRARALLAKLHDPASYGARFPVPSAPIGSAYFSDRRYWQGPTWINMNWFIIEGLARCSFDEEADRLLAATLDLVGSNGFREYYSPLTGEGFGAHRFSWTAALTLDLVARSERSA